VPSGYPATTSVYVAESIKRLSRNISAPALRYDGATVTAGELLASVHRYARALFGIGIRRSSLLALLAPNCPAALAVRYAANLIAAATTFLSVTASSAAQAELLGLTAPDLLVVFPETAKLVPVDGGIGVASAGGGVAGSGRGHSMRWPRAQATEWFACAARPDDLGVVISSGGSTGVLKGSWRTFAAYAAIVDVLSSAERRQLVNGRLAYLSQVLVDMTLLGGGTVVLRDGFDPADTLGIIQRERITDLFLVEPQLLSSWTTRTSRGGISRRCAA